MAEFKKLSAVEAVASVSDTASVLIEEDGVIKRAPKSEVGGVKVASTAEVGQTIVVKAVDEAGNPTEWECADNYPKPDMVITVNGSSIDPVDGNTCTITEGSVTDVFAAVKECRYPDVRIRFECNQDDGYVYHNREIIASAHIYGEWLYVGYMLNFIFQNYIYEGFICFNADGSFNSSNLKSVATTIMQ